MTSKPDILPDKEIEEQRTVQDEIYIDPVAEKALLRKLDMWIVPPVMLLYLLSFLDRVNIGNARLYGMEEDLGLVGDQYQLAVSVLFVTYIASELPSNLVIKKFRPSRWIAFITTAWGIVATLTGIVQDFKGLVACRVILGALEGGLFPGLTIYLTMFYTKREYALRIGYLFVSAAIAGSLGGLLAYGIGHMDGVAGLRGWRWIIIIEGIPTFILGIAVWFWLADDPDSAHYLTINERELIDARMRRQIGHTKSSDQMHKADVYAGLKDWKIWLFCIGQFGGDTILYGYSTFLPTIIRGLGDWNTAQVQALTIPCYAMGAITYLVVAWFSDRTQRRAVFTVILGLVCAIGYALLVSPAPSGVRYFGCFLAAMGLYVIVGLPLAWLPSNNPRYGKRTVATGLQLTIGNSAGIPAPFLYKTHEGPRFVKGHAISMALVAMSSLIYMAFWAWFRRQNQRKVEALLVSITDITFHILFIVPPIRTEKSNSAADAPAPGTDAPKKRLLKPVVKGVKDARFNSSVTDWDGKYHTLIGTSTRMIYFGYAFVLTDDHIDDILVLSRQVREKIWQFIFYFSDVSYTAKNGAKDLTNEAVIRLAKGLPNLRTVSLPSAERVGDVGFLALISNCPDLRLLEISPAIRSTLNAVNITAKAFDEFCEHPEWFPGLKQIVISDDESNKRVYEVDACAEQAEGEASGNAA
ncbi:major facilitator superfamily transporter [Fusarium mexicanum]|uniref:Major facilitator superfamily transporter n=1 Tax=Fusarium mexicanum TaxID=751941 RepID=A0A8H5MNT5_9HYPO|nr:major facilitator superfamily transporter [Fusarium mexicanum]